LTFSLFFRYVAPARPTPKLRRTNIYLATH
jgi:hypothetical protein